MWQKSPQKKNQAQVNCTIDAVPRIAAGTADAAIADLLLDDDADSAALAPQHRLGSERNP